MRQNIYYLCTLNTDDWFSEYKVWHLKTSSVIFICCVYLGLFKKIKQSSVLGGSFIGGKNGLMVR